MATPARQEAGAARDRRAPAPEPQHLGSEDEVYLAKLVDDLAEGKRRDEVGGNDRARQDRQAVEVGATSASRSSGWRSCLSVPEMPASDDRALRAALVERYEQRGELDTAIRHLEG